MSVIRSISMCCYAIIVAYASLAYAKLQPSKTVKREFAPIHVEVATTIRGNSKYEHGIYLFKIDCALESCAVERISLNECARNSGGQLSFATKTYSWASWAGFLDFKLSDNKLELMVFQGTHHQLPAHIILTFSAKLPPFTELKSFKATGFIDFAVWPEKNNLLEYIPTEGDQFKDLSCPVFLPGIHR